MMSLRDFTGEPRYLRLKRELREIVQAELKPGDRLPSEAEICEKYKVSRTTTRQAMSALEYEGLVTRQQGRGTFVAHDPRREETHHRALPQNRDLAAYETISLDLIDADLHVVEPLGREPSPSSMVRVRLRATLDSAPASYHVLYVPAELLKVPLSTAQSSSPIEMFGQLTREHVTEIEHSVSAARVDDFRARVLGLSIGAPVLLVQSVYRTDVGRQRALERSFISSAMMTIVFSEVLNG